MRKIILVTALLCATQFLQAQNNQPGCYPFPKTISVTGSSEMEIIPDEIYVQVDLREYKKSGDKVELEQIKTDFLRHCKTIGLPDSVISIASYEGYNNFWWKKRKKDAELFASISYQLKLSDSKKMDDLIKVLDEEATTNFKITKTSHSKIQDIRKQLKIQAIKSAKEKGNYLTESIGEKLGEVITIEEPGEFNYSDLLQSQAIIANSWARDEMKLSPAGEANIDFRKIKLRFEVKMVFAIK